MEAMTIAQILLPLALAPLAPGIINKTKAFFAGRKGPPLLQLYYDLGKLLRKGAVYSRTTSWVFVAGPVIGLAAVVTALLTVPLGPVRAVVNFSGDLILLAYLLGLMRFVTVLAALDTGSAFEGMGASREVTFSSLAEVAFLLGLAALAKMTGSLSLSDILSGSLAHTWATSTPEMALVAGAILVVFLAENARIPVDDPNTHLELTMIHEVMVLDHSGPDFAYIQYGAGVKLWVLGAVLVQVIVPAGMFGPWLGLAAFLGGMAVLCVVAGTIESCMARLRLHRVPLLLVAATALSVLALILTWRHSS
jgi:formate hydrogenlyase subunit 4